jgi:hypothetical protein
VTRKAGECRRYEPPHDRTGRLDAAVILGSAVKHPHDLVRGCCSVRANPDALNMSEANIAEIGSRPHAAGRLSWAELLRSHQLTRDLSDLAIE